jgi:hypothetical protein
MGSPNARRAADLHKLIRKIGGGDGSPGLRIAVVATTEPAPITLYFEGDNQALDLDIFEIPISLYPLRQGDRLFVFPITDTGDSNRWGAIEKITGGVLIGTVVGTHAVQVIGVDKVYDAELLPALPETFPVGDFAVIAPTLYNGAIRYVVLRTFKYA